MMKINMLTFFKDLFINFCVLFTVMYCLNLLIKDVGSDKHILLTSAVLALALKLIDKYLK